VSVGDLESGGGPLDGRESPRWLDGAVTVCIGLACGLLFHRYVVLPFAIGAGGTLTWIAAGLGSTAMTLRRRLGGSRGITWRRLTVGALAASAAAAAAFLAVPPLGYLRLETRRLPGFELALPSGEIDLTNASTYDRGQLTLKSAGGLIGGIELLWSMGHVNDAERLRGILAGATALAFERPPLGEPGQAAVLVPADPSPLSMSARDSSAWLTRASCGARDLLIVTLSSKTGAERLHRRVAASLQCHAAAGEAARSASIDVPIVLDLDARWRRMPSGSIDQLQLTDGSALLIAQLIYGTDPDKALDIMVSTHAIPGVDIGQRDGDRWPFEMRANGTRYPGHLEFRVCPELGQTLMLWWARVTDKATDDSPVLRTARCRKKDEPAQLWPPPLKTTARP
jgi:hypothetical protein